MVDSDQFSLYVSPDCGVHYSLHRQSPNMEELDKVCDALDESGLRWYVEDSHGRMMGRMSKIHRQILSIFRKEASGDKG